MAGKKDIVRAATFCVRRHPDRPPSRAHPIVHPLDAVRSTVDIQQAQSRPVSILCTIKDLGPSLQRHRRGVGATGDVLAHRSLLVLEGSPIFDRDLFGRRLFESVLRGSIGPRARFETIRTAFHKRMRPLPQKPTRHI